MEKADLSFSLNVGQTAPVTISPAVQGQSSPESGQGTPRRRHPPSDEASAESDEEAEEDEDRPEHRVDSLA
jgi:hypothetical protein